MRCAVVLLLAYSTLSTVLPAQTFKTLTNFDGTNGSVPYDTLVQSADGNFYGTASTGGAYSRGTVFELTPQGQLKALHSFQGQPHDGSYPYGGLLQASDGNFYGTTSKGGAKDQGTVFRMTPDGAVSIVYSFCAQSGCPDGSYPASSLAQGNDGNLYGITVYGGSSFCGTGCGTIFRITLHGLLTTLYSFCTSRNCTDGIYPYAGLALGSDGNFYGTTYAGGTYSLGTVFKMTPNGNLANLHSFSGKPSDGSFPYGAVVQGSDGNYYGTTSSGGGKDQGTVFRMTSKGSVTTLHSFCSQNACADGTAPQGALMQASDGNYYGTTSGSGSNCCGTAFAITPSGSLTTLHLFSGYPTDGSSPVSGLLQAADRRLYGTTQGGASGYNSCACGTVFSLPPPIVSLTVNKAGSGTVLSGDGHIYCGSVCSYSYLDGTQIGLTAIPGPGFTFDSWSGCKDFEGSFCSLTLAGPASVTATFKVADVTLTSLVFTPSSVKGGNISVATITLNQPAPPGGVAVSLTTDKPLVVHPPSQVVIPGDSNSYSFAVRTSVVRMTTVAGVTAWAGSSQVSATLTVTTGYAPPPQSAR